MRLKVNGAPRIITSDATTPMLWVLRDELNLTDMKFGCGIAACGACTVLVEGNVMRNSVIP
jgi:isoquinoline 1-oxidoreductase subunit alpha